MLFSAKPGPWGPVKKGKFDMTGRLVRRGLPVEIPMPGSATEIADLANAWKAKRDGSKCGDVADAVRSVESDLKQMQSSIRVIPQDAVIDDIEKQRQLYTKTGLLGIMGAGLP